ncbi:MAG: AAA family ATPase [Alphaproteobacteria bacterium]|nr:AAA family ATPase [Alphaproteobacteria bacterium]
MKRILAVASGKGGVGNTWFAISLGQALAQLNQRVLLVDGDVGLANVDIQLGLARTVDLTHVVMGEIPLSQAIQRVDALGLDVLPGRSGGGHLGGLDPMMVGWMQRELRRIGEGYDVVILDLPSGVEQGVRALMRQADDEIIVTTAEPTALTDAYALIKATHRNRLGGVPKIVVNFAEHETSGRQTLEGLVRVCERFLAIKPKQLGVIRRDPRVPEAIGRQVPLLQCYPRCDAARDVIAVAKAWLQAKDRA